MEGNLVNLFRMFHKIEKNIVQNDFRITVKVSKELGKLRSSSRMYLFSIKVRVFDYFLLRGTEEYINMAEIYLLFKVAINPEKYQLNLSK